jgi:hypothetical protein
MNKKEIIRYLNHLKKPIFSSKIKFGKSKISGFGLTAIKNIYPGEILVVEIGKIVNRKFIDLVYEKTGYECELCVGRNKYSLHAPLHQNNQGGYLNHSCFPNVGLAEDGVWVAIRKIKPNEEICCDYGTFETYPKWSMKCNCGSRNCRKIITEKDYLIPDLIKRLGKWYAPYLKKELKLT